MEPNFNSEKRGYNMKEVDEYIDWLRGEHDKMKDAVVHLEEKVTELELSTGDKESITQVMIAAQKFARQVEEEARAKANIMIMQAKEQVGKVLSEARIKAQNEIDSAMIKSKQIFGQTEEKNATVQAKLHEIYEILLPIMGKSLESKKDEERVIRIFNDDRVPEDEQEALSGIHAVIANFQTVKTG